jgi:nicotinamidase/pyrazinamidase
VQGTKGAETHPDLDTRRIQHFARAGTKVDIDGYSGFVDTDLEDELRLRGVRRVFVTGLATDYCVKHTALDAVGLGYETVVLTDACRAVDVDPGDSQAALDEMREAGATLATSAEINS